MPEKIKRSGHPRPDISLGFAECWWDKPVVNFNDQRFVVRLSGIGSLVILHFDHEQFADLFDAMCEAVRNSDRMELKSRLEPEIPQYPGPNLA
jgi:hypothetical protein